MAVAGYNIYVDGVKKNTSLVTNLTYALSGLTASTSYAVTVSAVDDSGNESAQSAAVNFTTNASGGGGNGYDTDFQEKINYANANSIPVPPEATLDYYNQRVINYKASGAWDLDDAVYDLSGVDGNFTEFRLIDIKRRVKAEAIGGLTWDANGVKGDASTGYIKSAFNPAVDGVNFQVNNASVMFKITGGTVTSRDAVVVGIHQTWSQSITIKPYYGSSPMAYVNGRTNANVRTDAPGLCTVNRLASEITVIDGADVTTTSAMTDSPTQLVNGEVYILARNLNGTADSFDERKIGFVAFGAEKTGVHNAIKTAI